MQKLLKYHIYITHNLFILQVKKAHISSPVMKLTVIKDCEKPHGVFVKS